MSAPTAPVRQSVHDGFLLVTGTAYTALVTNLALVVAALPLVVVLLTTDPARSWPLLALLAPPAAPGLAAAFAVFGAFSADPGAPAVRTFVRAWRRTACRSLQLGTATVAALVVLGVDLRWAWDRRVGAVAVPVLAVMLLGVAVTGLHALVLVVERPEARLRDVVRAAGYLAVRRWYLTAVSVAVLGLLLGLLAAHPALALGMACAPLLYVVWANTRFALRPVLTTVTRTG